MHRRYHLRGESGFHKFSSLARHTEVFSKEGLSGSRTEANENLGRYQLYFSFQPGTTGVDLGVAGLFMNAPLPFFRGNPAEMLHGIGDVDFGPVNSRFQKSLV